MIKVTAGILARKLLELHRSRSGRVGNIPY